MYLIKYKLFTVLQNEVAKIRKQELDGTRLKFLELKTNYFPKVIIAKTQVETILRKLIVKAGLHIPQYWTRMLCFETP